MERKNKILKTVSVVLLLCSFAVPMYNIFPNGLIVNQDSWFFTETFKILFQEGVGAFNYLGVVFHLAVWISAIILCIGSFAQMDKIVRFSAGIGIVLLLIGLLLAVVLTNEIKLIHPIVGYICIGYWIDIILFPFIEQHKYIKNKTHKTQSQQTCEKSQFVGFSYVIFYSLTAF